jgi:hypothetical protein
MTVADNSKEVNVLKKVGAAHGSIQEKKDRNVEVGENGRRTWKRSKRQKNGHGRVSHYKYLSDLPRGDLWIPEDGGWFARNPGTPCFARVSKRSFPDPLGQCHG